MSEAPKLFRELYSKLSEYQKDLHLPSGQTDNPLDPENLVHSSLISTAKKTIWQGQYLIRVSPSVSGDRSEVCTYVVKGAPHHGLAYSYLSLKLPAVRAKEGFEVRWCPNPVSNQVENGELIFNEVSIQTFDSVYCDMFYQTMISPRSVPSTERSLGNTSSLQSWSDTLPAYPAEVLLPWFYSKDEASFFPLYKCGSLDRLEHKIVLRRNLQELLLVRNISTGVQEPASSSNVEVSGCSLDDKLGYVLPIPEMYGLFYFLSPEECDFNRCREPKNQVLQVDSVYSLDSEITGKVGETLEILFSKEKLLMEYPVHTVQLVLQNQNARDSSQHSNYTTNSDEHLKGYSPIDLVSLRTATGKLLSEIPGRHLEGIHHAKHFNTTPRVPGYVSWSMGVNATSGAPRPGVPLQGGSISVRIGDPNPLLDFKSQEACVDSFRLRVRLIYTREIQFTKYPTTEEKRLEDRASIRIRANKENRTLEEINK